MNRRNFLKASGVSIALPFMPSLLSGASKPAKGNIRRMVCVHQCLGYEAGAFFDKIECFCFVEQVLMPGETVMMPVSFFVHPDIVDDREGQYVHTITLSYTFYEIDVPEEEIQASYVPQALTPATQDAIQN